MSLSYVSTMWVNMCMLQIHTSWGSWTTGQRVSGIIHSCRVTAPVERPLSYLGR